MVSNTNEPFCPKRDESENNNLSGTMLVQKNVYVVSLIHEVILKDHVIIHEIVGHSTPTNTILSDSYQYITW